MNEETLKNLSREEAIYYLDNQMDYTYQLQKRIDKAIDFIKKLDKECEEDGCSFVNLIEVLKILEILKNNC